LHCVFRSSKQAILAAKEAKDGSQILAVADRHNVILHDCKRNREQSWGIDGSNATDQVRLLEYTNDGRKLFLSTSLTGQIQCFSLGREGDVGVVGREHPRPPTVMAVSPDGELMISASEQPTVVYLQDLKNGGIARQLHPGINEISVVVAAFHPERRHVFLLGFKDGTMVGYEVRGAEGRNKGQVDVINAFQDLDGAVREIGRFPRLHRMTTRAEADQQGFLDAAAPDGRDRSTGTGMCAVGAKGVALTAAAFLPGYKSRAVSVGGDGECKLVEFEAGCNVLRT
jgi:hypothetical protein